MELSAGKIKQLLKTPAGASWIRDAKNHEDRIKLHAKTVNDSSKASPYFKSFLNWVKDGIRLQSDKYAVFEQMCQFPLPTTSLCDSIFDEFARIFYANDSVSEVTLLDSTMKQEFENFLTDLDLREYFRTRGFDIYKKQPNSIFVVDLPAVQTTQRPQPYFYNVPLAKVRDIEVIQDNNGRDKITYIIYEISKDTFVAIDDNYFRTFQKVEQQNFEEAEFALLGESFHGLGYVPATFMNQSALYDAEDSSPVTRRSPISASLSDLDWLLFYKVGERMYQTYGVFPIYTVPETNCSFIDGAGNQCSSGVVSYLKDGQTYHYKCPACKENNFVGAGTVFTKPVPKSKDFPELKDPVTITPPDVDSLKFIAENIDAFEWGIYENCVGSNDDIVSKEAVNEKQVQANAEGKRNTLYKIKRDFEAVETFIVNAMGNLMFGDYYVSSNINYGEDFLLYTEADLVAQYETAKKAGLPNFIVSEKKDSVVRSLTRNNGYEEDRMRILNLLEPFTELSLGECVVYQFQSYYPEKFLLKADFSKFVNRFELENGDIVEWGSKIAFDKKIEKINLILNQYVKEQVASAKPIESERPDGNDK